jgi:hypothetical protein
MISLFARLSNFSTRSCFFLSGIADISSMMASLLMGDAHFGGMNLVLTPISSDMIRWSAVFIRLIVIFRDSHYQQGLHMGFKV